MNTYTLYVLKEPDSGDIRYVGITGKSLDIRLAEHCKNGPAINAVKYRWIQYLKNHGLKPVISPVLERLSLDDAKREEISLIYRLRQSGVRIWNLTNGGDAVMVGRKHRPETIALMSKRHKGMANHFFGKTHTKETREKLSAKLKGRKSWNKGRRLTVEHLLALSEARFGKEPWNKGKSKLDMLQIKCLVILKVPQTEIAKLVGASQATVSRIVSGVVRNTTRPTVAERFHANA